MNRIELQYKFDDELQDTAEVWINGVIEGTKQKFILDTGCATTSLFYNDFSSKFKSLGEHEYSSAFGKALSDTIEVKSIGAGPIQHANIQISRTRDGGNDKNLFGMDLLSETLHLDSRSIPFLELNLPSSKAIAVWDTGAGITIVNREFFESHRDLFDSGGKTIGTDSAGKTFETEIYRMKSIRIGEHLFPAHRVVPLNLSHIADKTGHRMDFILGYSTLRLANWVMDFPNHRWAITKTLF